MPDFSLIAVILFIVFFVIQTFRHHQFQWLWFAIALWLSMGLFSAYLMPRVLGITHLFNLYLVHLYVFLGSIFFFINSAHRLPERKLTWQASQTGSWLSLFATSGVAMHSAFLMLLILISWHYPSGSTAILSARLLTLYTLDPLYWYAIQAFVMVLFALHRWIQGDAPHVFSLSQLYTGFLLCLIWQFLYLLGVYQWLSHLLQMWLHTPSI